jgi:predicted amidohydrolase
MRILLAAVNARKGDLGGNLARHLRELERARANGCQVAVFPELSLTGSVDDGYRNGDGAGTRTSPGVAAGVTVHPVREAVRCLLVDHAGRALLVR